MNPGAIPVGERHQLLAYARAWQLLTPSQDRVLVWWVRGMGYRRIGQVLDIPAGNARGLIDRAVANTERHWNQHGQHL